MEDFRKEAKQDRTALAAAVEKVDEQTKIVSLMPTGDAGKPSARHLLDQLHLLETSAEKRVEVGKQAKAQRESAARATPTGSFPYKDR